MTLRSLPTACRATLRVHRRATAAALSTSLAPRKVATTAHAGALVQGLSPIHSVALTTKRSLSSVPNKAATDATAVAPAQPSPGFSGAARGVLTLMGWYKPKNVRIRAATALFRACQQQAERTSWHKRGLIGDDFRSRHALLSAHVWMMHRRLLKEGHDGRKVQETLFDELWNETTRRLRSVGIAELSVNKYLAEVQQYAFGAMVDYDQSLTAEDPDLALADAVRRNIYLQDAAPMPAEHAAEVARYLRHELESLMELPSDAVLSGRIAFGDMPEWAAVRSLQPGTAADRRAERSGSGSGAAKEETPLVASPAAASADEDDWRPALTEGGKTYYWNIRTREATWEKPPQ